MKRVRTSYDHEVADALVTAIENFIDAKIAGKVGTIDQCRYNLNELIVSQLAQEPLERT